MDVYYKFFKLISFFLALCDLSEVVSSEVPRPRGVSLSRAALYNPEKNFECFDNSRTIPFSQVNDDYCDCQDASDEPGTSACPHGVFHCTNAGHKPLNVASNRINDGVCDCCDGSDEYANRKIKCINNCIELGRSAREEAQRREELIKAGKQLREELSQKGIHLKQEKKETLIELRKNKEEAEKVRTEKESIKKLAEDSENASLEYYKQLEDEERKKKLEAEETKNRAEAVEIFNKFDSNQDGKVDLSELQTRASFDRDKNGEVSIEEARHFLNNEDAVDIEQFVSSAWSNIKPFLMMNAGVFKPPIDGVNEGNTDTPSPVDEEGHEDGPEEETDEEEEEEQETEPESEQTEEHAEDEVPPSRQYDEETQKLIDTATAARNEYTEADRAVKNLDTEIKGIEDYLDKDFGLDEEFASLQSECYEYSDHEYIYKLCPFDKTIQMPKSGSQETRLGTWGKWVGSENKYDVMLYERGQACWNGPQRSTHVRISCGSDNKIVSVSEPNKCEYLFDFVTPAACSEPSSGTNENVHDEL